METCVLIPQEFALAVTGSGARASKEPTVSVWSTNRIPQGSLCYPFQGTIRIDKLDLYSQLDESDVSVNFYFSHFLDSLHTHLQHLPVVASVYRSIKQSPITVSQSSSHQ